MKANPNDVDVETLGQLGMEEGIIRFIDNIEVEWL